VRRREQPLRPTSQVAIMLGPQYQVEVVGHEAIAEQVHRQASASVDHRLDEGVVIAGLAEDGLAAVAPIEGVIPHATDRRASGSRHAITMVDEVPDVNKGVCPRFSDSHGGA
jgi:hypothetical protein